MARVEIDGTWSTFNIRVELDRIDLIKLLNNPNVRHIDVQDIGWHGSSASGVTANIVRGDIVPDSPVESESIVNPMTTAISAS